MDAAYPRINRTWRVHLMLTGPTDVSKTNKPSSPSPGFPGASKATLLEHYHRSFADLPGLSHLLEFA